jgi:DDE superfamily endonuclease
LRCGEPASSNTPWPDSKTPHAPVAPRSFPPDERVEVITLASQRTAEHDCPATRWGLDDLARELVNRHAHEAMHRSTIRRILHDADLQPHRSVYWLNSHDPDFDTKAAAICQLYVRSPILYQQGELVISTDEKTGMQILQRKYPTQPARPGHPEKREHEYIRHGTRALIASFVVPTGEVVWNLGPTRTSRDFANHLKKVADHFRDWSRITWVVDHLNTHWSRQACAVLAALNGLAFDPRRLSTGAERRAFLTDPEHAYRFVYAPKHGSWLNQVELWFSVLVRRFLKRGEFASAVEFGQRLTTYVDTYNAREKHPYRWTYAGQPLVRATPFSQTRRQQRQGRAWFGTRSQRFERFLYPPRPYKRRATS